MLLLILTPYSHIEFMGRIQIGCDSTWRYLLGPFTWFEWANPGWDPSHKTLFRFNFTEKDKKNMRLNLMSLQRQILINVSFSTGKNRIILQDSIFCINPYQPVSTIYYFFKFLIWSTCVFYLILPQYIKAFSCSPFPICHKPKCDFTVTYTRLICSAHLCPAVMFSQDQLYSDPWKWEVQHWWGKKRDH